MTHVAVLIGSVRNGRNTGRLAHFLHRRLQRRDDVDSELVDLRELDLPVLPERLAHLPDPPPALVRFGATVERADAVLIVTPEYNKGYPAALKNAIDALGPQWKRKPVGIAAHSVGAFGGSVVVQQLRIVMLSIGALPIPASITCPYIDRTFETDGTPLDDRWPARGDRFVDELVWYARAIREADHEPARGAGP